MTSPASKAAFSSITASTSIQCIVDDGIVFPRMSPLIPELAVHESSSISGLLASTLILNDAHPNALFPSQMFAVESVAPSGKLTNLNVYVYSLFRGGAVMLMLNAPPSIVCRVGPSVLEPSAPPAGYAK